MADIVEVHSDGGVIARNPSPIGGVWAACHVGRDATRVQRFSGILRPSDVAGEPVSNNVTEWYALMQALDALPDGWSGRICSDSKITLGRFFWGWKVTGIPLAWYQRVPSILARLGTLTPVLHAGHPTKVQLAAGFGRHGYPVSIQNVWCDEECSRLAAEDVKRTALLAVAA